MMPSFVTTSTNSLSLYLLLLTLLCSYLVDSELIAVKDAGSIGYYDANQKWRLLHENIGRNQMAEQIASCSEGLWALAKKRGAAYMNPGNSKKWSSVRKSFISITTNHKESLYGVSR